MTTVLILRKNLPLSQQLKGFIDIFPTSSIP